MNTTTKKFAFAGLGAAFALTLSLGVGLMKNNPDLAWADTDTVAPNASAFFYDNLLDSNNNEYALAKRFYEVLDKMNEEDDFRDGVVDYRLDDVVTSDQLRVWVEDGNLEIPRAFGAARDAFLTDHPELFYINFYKMTISVAKSGGKYVGYVNSGREANLYYENGFNTLATVNEAIDQFNGKINEIVAEMNRLEEEDTYTPRNAYLAKEVSRYLAENIKYDYVAYDNKNDPNYTAASYINTAYGGLVVGKAVCGGYSTAYKVIMDKLGIPCITVNGYSNNKDLNGNNSASNVYHMWNYVYLETPTARTAQTYAVRSAAPLAAASQGEWYSVDVTWNFSASNKYRFTLLNAERDEKIHVNDGVISSSGYRMRYPSLSAYNYGSTGETSGLQTSVEYTPDGGTDDFGKPRQQMFVSVSYNGKSAKRLLEEDNLYISFRNAEYQKNPDTGKMELIWTDWSSLEVFRQFAIEQSGIQDKLIEDTGSQTRYYDNTSIRYTQFAVFDVKPDREYANDPKYDSWPKHDPVTESYRFFWYSNDLLNDTNPVETSKVLVNESYGTYTPAPYIQQDNQQTIVISDSMRDPSITDKVVMAENKAIVFEVTYDEELYVLDSLSPIEISFVSDHPNTKDYAKFFPVNTKGEYVELVQRAKNSNDPTLVYNTLRFKFAPSLMYEHDQEGYYFTFSNVGSAKKLPVFGNGINEEPTGEKTSNKLPNPAYYNFGRQVVACPAYFNYDGRLYIDCCAAPTLVTQSDLSEDNFKDKDGNSLFSENERSQMMLVAERASDATVDTMLSEITDHDGINVTSDDIKKSETYDIRLQMCNKYPTIPDGSYVKIGLGFPEGYGPDDEGVTFKLFHRKHDPITDTYSIEEVPCVVTQFGIVATVTSFSPYMVAVVDSDKATDKTVYASIEGKGGKLTMEDGKIQTVKEGKSYTYTIQPDEGYQIYSVKLNGAEVKDRVQSGSLALTYEELKTNNELVIQYIATEAANRIQAKLDSNVIDEQIEVTKYVVAVKDQPVYSNAPLPRVGGNADNGGDNVTAAIVIVSVTCVLAAAAVVTCILVARKKKKQS